MYRVLVVLSFALLAACSPNEVPSEHLVERQGVFYEINSQTPFTGRSVSYHKNGQLESTVNWKDGKKDGPGSQEKIHPAYSRHIANGPLHAFRR